MHHTVLTINRKRLIQIKYLGKMILVANKMEQLPTNNYRSMNLHLCSSLLDQGSQQHILRDDLLTSVNLSIQNRVGRRIFAHLGMKTILGIKINHARFRTNICIKKHNFLFTSKILPTRMISMTLILYLEHVIEQFCIVCLSIYIYFTFNSFYSTVDRLKFVKLRECR